MADSKKEMHETMRRVYELVDLEQTELAMWLNVSPQNVNNWEKRGISKKGLELLSKRFGFNQSYISMGQLPVLTNPSIMAKEGKKYKFNMEYLTNAPVDELVRQGLTHEVIKPISQDFSKFWVPVKSYTRMGLDGFYTDMGFEGNGGDGYVPSLTASDAAYAVRGTGDSMYPAIRSGWYMICDPKADPVPSEFVEVVLKDGRRTIKEFIGISGNVLNLIGVNGDKRITFDMTEVEAIVPVVDIVPPSRHVYELPDLEIIDYELKHHLS